MEDRTRTCRPPCCCHFFPVEPMHSTVLEARGNTLISPCLRGTASGCQGRTSGFVVDVLNWLSECMDPPSKVAFNELPSTGVPVSLFLPCVRSLLLPLTALLLSSPLPSHQANSFLPCPSVPRTVGGRTQAVGFPSPLGFHALPDT